ncbi:MAG: topoisomerase [Thaumarchaeota archaeon]|nr:topoisomerase [Nitrososphaerota archaeon]
MEYSESEASDLKDFVRALNSKKDSMVVVEGRKDEEALKLLGFSGKICQFHSFKGLARFVDSVTGYKSLILLLDSDRKGAYLTRRICSQLEHRLTVDLSFRRRLNGITRGKARHIEDLRLYVEDQ